MLRPLLSFHLLDSITCVEHNPSILSPTQTSDHRVKPTRRYSAVLVVTFGVIVLPLPLYAYGDPTGGALFQILGPLLAVLWGAWMIFANGVRKRVGNLVRRFRGVKEIDSDICPPNQDPHP